MFNPTNSMKKLISRHFYKTKEEALSKCDVFMMVGRITDDEYLDLCALIKENYPDEVETAE